MFGGHLGSEETNRARQYMGDDGGYQFYSYGACETLWDTGSAAPVSGRHDHRRHRRRRYQAFGCSGHGAWISKGYVRAVAGIFIHASVSWVQRCAAESKRDIQK